MPKSQHEQSSKLEVVQPQPSDEAAQRTGKVGIRGALTTNNLASKTLRSLEGRFEERRIAKNNASDQRRRREDRLRKELATSIKADKRGALLNIGSNFDYKRFAQIRKETEPWSTVEINPGSRPSGLNRSFSGKSTYQAVVSNPDLGYTDLAQQKLDMISAKRQDENLAMVTATEVSSGSVNEVFAVLTMGQPTDAEADTASIFASYANRILQPGGSMIIYDMKENLVNIANGIQGSGLRLTAVSTATQGGSRFYENAADVGVYQTSTDLLVQDTELTRPDLMVIATKVPVEKANEAVSLTKTPPVGPLPPATA